MARYVAFLRGINVGGNNMVRMEGLRLLFASLGFTNVRTYIQSGNVLFDAAVSPKQILAQLDRGMQQAGITAHVIVLSHGELERIVALDPFGKRPPGKYFVTFLATDLPKGTKFPLFSKNKDVEIFVAHGSVVFSESREVNGKFGFPNLFVEKAFKMPATTRNWNVVRKLASL